VTTTDAPAATPPSVQLYTVREALAADMPAALARLAAIGFRTVEGFDLVGLEDSYAAALPGAGLAMPGAHVTILGADLERVFAAAHRLGVTTVIEPWVSPERWTRREDVETIAAELSAVAARAEGAGLRIGYHNHWFELENSFAGVTALEVFAAALDPRVVLEVDTYWVEVGGERAPALLRRLGQRVQLLHVKDGPRTRDTSMQTAVGSGSLPIADILAAAPWATRVVELDAYGGGDVFDAVAESRRFLVEDLGRIQPAGGVA
jgi:sugar phosphate isomerase/epimerase